MNISTHFYKEKKKGEFTDIMAVVIFMFMSAVIFQVFLNNQKAVDIKDDIDATINQYVLCLETDGYLSETNQNSLINDLTKLGVTDIDLTGTDDVMNPKIYGERVALQVKGNLEVPTFQIAWLRLEKGAIQIQINEKRISISHGIS